MSFITEILKECGFYRCQGATEQLCEQAYRMNALAGTAVEELTFEAFPSFIPSRRISACLSHELIVDIGGTSTKVGLRSCTEEGGHSWLLLFEKKNDEFLSDEHYSAERHSFEHFVELLTVAILEKVRECGVSPDKIFYCGIVWSNAVANKYVPGIGVTGIVAARGSYSKGEWFLRDLKDGDDIGNIFTIALHEAGIPISYLILSNDTVFTMTALGESDAGMVASTGLNGTLVKPLSLFQETDSDRHIICNGEIGGRFVIDDSLLSEGDWISNDKRARTIEDLTAGRFLPLIFARHIEFLADNGLKAFVPLVEQFDLWHEFRAKDMGLLMADKPLFCERRSDAKPFTGDVLELLEQLSRELFLRSAHLCSIVAYSTVANQVEQKNSFLVALDSRLSREVPVFQEQFNRSLSEVMPSGRTCVAQLVEPLVLESGKISVPMQGAANALDSLAARNAT